MLLQLLEQIIPMTTVGEYIIILFGWWIGVSKYLLGVNFFYDFATLFPLAVD